jgi:thiamine-monophosphate kinase
VEQLVLGTGMTAEDDLIKRVSRAMGSAKGAKKRRRTKLGLGIGDDAALLACGRDTELVLSCDTTLEGIHFLADRHPADSVGYKALARATSDLAAMGATPGWFLMTLTLPETRTGKWLDRFLQGIARAAREFGIVLAGGDTTRSGAVFISITVIGEVPPGRAVRRAGARPGDGLYVSGVLGAAELGLEMLRKGGLSSHVTELTSHFSPLERHLYPQIRVGLGAWLARNGIASAMMDISDGLSTDLARLCAASGVGARVDAERLPRVEISAVRKGSTRVARSVARVRFDPLELALHGGEDYELLFAVSPKNEARLSAARRFCPITRIGEITRGHGVVLVTRDGAARPLRPHGWDPFRK